MSDQNLIHILEDAVPAVLEQKSAYMDMFQKNTYKDAFERFLQDQKSWLEALGRDADAQPADSALIKEAAGQFAGCAKKRLDAVKSGSKRDKELLDLNLYMVTYVLPGILECCGRETGKAVTDAVCAEWAAHFKHSRIQAARYTEIDAGFKRKLCYITTAACEALKLGEDCEELLLMRRYRDGFLTKRQGGTEMIREYYDIAPTIVKRIEKAGHAKEEYTALYETYIAKCVQMIKDGAYEECLAVYKDMVLMLRDRFLVTKR